MQVIFGSNFTNLVEAWLTQAMDRLMREHLETKAKLDDIEKRAIEHNWDAQISRFTFVYHHLRVMMLERQRVREKKKLSKLSEQMNAAIKALAKFKSGNPRPAIAVLKLEHARMIEFRLHSSISMGAATMVIPPEEREIAQIINSLIEATEPRDFELAQHH